MLAGLRYLFQCSMGDLRVKSTKFPFHKTAKDLIIAANKKRYANSEKGRYQRARNNKGWKTVHDFFMKFICKQNIKNDSLDFVQCLCSLFPEIKKLHI